MLKSRRVARAGSMNLVNTQGRRYSVLLERLPTVRWNRLRPHFQHGLYLALGDGCLVS